jgi:hypothetical protein
MIVTNPNRAVDNRIVVNEVRLGKTKVTMGTLPTDSGAPQTLVVGSEVHKWLKSKLFSQGLKSVAEPGALTWDDVQEWTREENVLWKWLAIYDRSHQNERMIGGAALSQTLKEALGVMLYHSGYLTAALVLGQILGDSLTEATQAQMLESLKPPLFLTRAWQGATKLKTEAMRIKQSSVVQYPLIAQYLSSRLAFLFELEPCCPEQAFGFFSRAVKTSISSCLDELSKNAKKQEKVVSEIVDIVRLFAVHDQTFNSNGIAFFRAALRYVDELAKLRFHAFKCLRSSSGIAGSRSQIGFLNDARSSQQLG